MSQKKEVSRREFLGRGVAGLGTLAMSPALVELLLSTGCSSAGRGSLAELIVPEDVLRRAVGFLTAKGASFGDVFVERSAFDTISSDDRKINTSTSVEKGVGLRAVKNGRTFYGYTSSFEPERIYAAARYVADAAAQGASGSEASLGALELQKSKFEYPILPRPSDVPAEKKIELFRALTDRAWSADPRIVQVIVFMRETIRQVNIATSSHKAINQTLGLTEFAASTHMKGTDGVLQNGFDMRGAYAGRDFFTGSHSFEHIVDNSVERARKLLEAVDSPRGVFPVILGPGENGVLFHESCGHGMEADLVFKGSNFKGQIGKQTAARGVTLIDDGNLPYLTGSYAFDDEGTPAQRTILIEDGIQKSYLCDLVWGPRLGLQSTGNGRRQSFRYPPIPRMRNTFIDRGTQSPEEIISSTKRGIYVKSVGGGGQVDVITGHFMMGVGEGYLIEDGKITRPIKGATLSGMGIEALKSIDMIGSDLEMHPSAGRCGKMQAVPVSFGMPTIRVRGILVGGRGEAWSDQAGGAR